MKKSHGYFGDGVYVTMDESGHSVMTTSHHEPAFADNQIYLEPGMIKRVQQWIDAGAPDHETGHRVIEPRPDPGPPG